LRQGVSRAPTEAIAEVSETVIDVRVKLPAANSSDGTGTEVPEEYLRYTEVYEGFREGLDYTIDDWIAEAGAHGVGPSIMQAEVEWADYRELNDRLAAAVHDHPEELACGFACVDPRDGMRALREVDRAVNELGLRGIVFEPGFLGISPLDRRCYPVYAKCAELGTPVGLHTGINFSSHGPLEYERPILIDRIAGDFPELTIICHHGGWPWPHEAAAVAWKHKNVYLEFGAIAPRYQAAGAGGGWGDIAHLMDTVLRDQVLFGTDWPMLRYDRAFAEIDLLGLRDESRAAYLGGNAQRLLERILDR
jgi:predicted TIM-barrel fold metal-dependent hydrolase